MAATPTIDADQAATLAGVRTITQGIDANQARAFATINFPTRQERMDQARVQVLSKVEPTMEVNQAIVLAAVLGRVANPSVRISTFTIDAHDFVVLRLGDDTTLIYDTLTQQWVEWDSAQNGAWRPNLLFTWVGAAGLAYKYGSSIIAGDDTFGLLWFLNPALAYDQAPDPARAYQQIAFERIVTGQVLANGRQYLPCYAIFVDGDNYGLTATDFVPQVRLDTSDDQGRTFDQHDTLTVNPDTGTNNPYSWYSLGQINSPGRMFRVVDNGLFARIDAMEMNDDAG